MRAWLRLLPTRHELLDAGVVDRRHRWLDSLTQGSTAQVGSDRKSACLGEVLDAVSFIFRNTHAQPFVAACFDSYTGPSATSQLDAGSRSGAVGVAHQLEVNLRP